MRSSRSCGCLLTQKRREGLGQVGNCFICVLHRREGLGQVGNRLTLGMPYTYVLHRREGLGQVGNRFICVLHRREGLGQVGNRLTLGMSYTYVSYTEEKDWARLGIVSYMGEAHEVHDLIQVLWLPPCCPPCRRPLQLLPPSGAARVSRLAAKGAGGQQCLQRVGQLSCRAVASLCR